MARFTGYKPCPRCRERGADRTGDNLGTWSDESAHCFSCGYHVSPSFLLKAINKEPEKDDQEKAVLPSDFTREVPPEGWKWLLQYGLSYSYWKAFTGYTPSENRLVITHGNPIKFSIGRALSVGDRKWRFYGNGHHHVQTIGETLPGKIVLVEDIVSSHKVGQVTPCLCLFGTHVFDLAIKELQKLDRPVSLWLDADQYDRLPGKISKLKTFLKHDVGYIYTEKDPKEYSLEEIKQYVNSN